MVEAALAEAGQPYDVVDLDLKLARPAEYLALNPSGKIPALRFPDGTVMAQSAAILMALAERHPHAHLLPEPDAPDRRAALHWLILATGWSRRGGWSATGSTLRPSRPMPSPACASAG
ncbi:MAG: glutathione S-transferase family protein [Hyphomicrobiales bacterium]